MKPSSSNNQLKVFLKVFLQWVESQRLVEGAILVGSHARGGAQQDSDIDLVLLCTEYESYLEDVSSGSTTLASQSQFVLKTTASSLLSVFSVKRAHKLSLASPSWTG